MIRSNKNALVKELQLLQKKKRQRNKQGVFIVEGLRAVKEIPPNWPIHQYVLAEDFDLAANQLSMGKNVPLVHVTEGVFASISDTKTPQGIMAVVAQPQYDPQKVMAKEKGFFIIADQVQDPGNLGTLIRTAHASGAHGVFLSKGCVDVYNPKTIRATMGSIFHIPVVIDLEIREIIQNLADQGTNIYATALENSKVLYHYDYRQKTGIIIGNEANGISDQTKSLVDYFIKIPMPGGAESLNASIAAGICMFEVVRQRKC